VLSTPRAEKLLRVTRTALSDPEEFSRLVIGRPLYPYQAEALRGIVPYLGTDAIDSPEFVVMMARQGGKNEMSAHLEAFLLNRLRKKGGQIVKASPTFKPQTVNSMERLKLILDNWWNRRRWRTNLQYMVRLGLARVLFFSADPQAQVVGATADVLLEGDEAQDIDETKWGKDFMPMVAVSNAPRIYYGTAWTNNTLLAKKEAEATANHRRDGVRRVFKFDWEMIARSNPRYKRFVEGEIRALGIDHPIVKTQYRLLDLSEEGTFLSDHQLALMEGDHPRARTLAEAAPLVGAEGPFDEDVATTADGPTVVMGIDFAGEDEEERDEVLRLRKPRKDSTVTTIALLDWSRATVDFPYPEVKIVDHYWWTGHNHATQYRNLARLVDAWRAQIVVCDNQGVGAGVTSFLRDKFGEVVIPYDFNQSTKSDLGFHFLAKVNTDRLKMYHEGSPSPEGEEFWYEMEQAQQQVRSMKRLSFFVPEDEGHDDFLVSAALCAWATRYVPIPIETASVRGFHGRGR
jgi:hypothetical protein